MKLLLPLILLAAAPCYAIAQDVAPGTPIYKVSDIVKDGLKGQIKTQTTTVYFKAHRITAQWEPSDTASYIRSITYYNPRGFIDSIASVSIWDNVADWKDKATYKYIQDSLVSSAGYDGKSKDVTRYEYPTPFTIIRKVYKKGAKGEYLVSATEKTFDNNYKVTAFRSKQYDDAGNLKAEDHTSIRFSGDTEYRTNTSDGKTTNITNEIAAKDEHGNRTIEVFRSNNGSQPSITTHTYQYY